MKKIKFLAPLASAACIISSVTPLVFTSCANSNLIDLTKGYYTTYKARDHKIFNTNAEATDDWAKWLKASIDAGHRDYFSQEYYWSGANFVTTTNYVSGEAKYSSDNEKISNLSIQFKNTSLEKDEYVPFISFTHKYDLTYSGSGLPIGVTERHKVGCAKYTNIPFKVMLSGTHSKLFDDERWMIYPDFQFISNEFENGELSFDYGFQINESITDTVKISEQTQQTQTTTIDESYNQAIFSRFTDADWTDFVETYKLPICYSFYLYCCDCLE